MEGGRAWRDVLVRASSGSSAAKAIKLTEAVEAEHSRLRRVVMAVCCEGRSRRRAVLRKLALGGDTEQQAERRPHDQLFSMT
ncbi:hypothetical protein [Bradyrhizobium genosp. P]|uniref:hypothetical protein n=1 Tax=Bradyrhizobium genosp. P TaxID=83641 RepID=UPI003CE7F78E